jgi:hypothetical protein
LCTWSLAKICPNIEVVYPSEGVIIRDRDRDRDRVRDAAWHDAGKVQMKQTFVSMGYTRADIDSTYARSSVGTLTTHGHCHWIFISATSNEAK